MSRALANEQTLARMVLSCHTLAFHNENVVVLSRVPFSVEVVVVVVDFYTFSCRNHNARIATQAARKQMYTQYQHVLCTYYTKFLL